MISKCFYSIRGCQSGVKALPKAGTSIPKITTFFFLLHTKLLDLRDKCSYFFFSLKVRLSHVFIAGHLHYEIYEFKNSYQHIL